MDRPVCGHANGSDAELCSSCDHRFALGPTPLAGNVPHETPGEDQPGEDRPAGCGRRTVSMLFAGSEGATATRPRADLGAAAETTGDIDAAEAAVEEGLGASSAPSTGRRPLLVA